MLHLRDVSTNLFGEVLANAQPNQIIDFDGCKIFFGVFLERLRLLVDAKINLMVDPVP
jgi:hypothetical protein